MNYNTDANNENNTRTFLWNSCGEIYLIKDENGTVHTKYTKRRVTILPLLP